MSDHRQRHQQQRARARFLHPGGWAVSGAQPLATLLGSCIAVCLWDPALRLAGMNHFLLPSMQKREHHGPDTLLAGDQAMEVLVNAMLKRGALRKRLQAKLFGGGNVAHLPSFEIGTRNAAFAEDWLRLENIAIVAADVGGAYARTVVLLPDTGEALCKRTGTLSGARVKSIAARETAYERQLQTREDDIELF